MMPGARHTVVAVRLLTDPAAVDGEGVPEAGELTVTLTGRVAHADARTAEMVGRAVAETLVVHTTDPAGAVVREGDIISCGDSAPETTRGRWRVVTIRDVGGGHRRIVAVRGRVGGAL